MKHEVLQLILGIVFGTFTIPLIFLICKAFIIQVDNETNILMCRFGKLVKIFKKPGLHFCFEKILPTCQTISVSLKKDFRTFEEIHINDLSGTTIIIDLWVEFNITCPVKAAFQVENLEKSLQSTLTSAATSILGTLEFKQILSNRNALNQKIKDEIKNETLRWGITVDKIFISKLSLLPEVSQQLFDTVAARLEKAKADIEEVGRLDAQLLEAETSSKVAALVAEAKGQYSLCIGNAYQKLAQNPELFDAYTKLYEYSLIKPHRTIAFQGFSDEEMFAMQGSLPQILSYDETSTFNPHTQNHFMQNISQKSTSSHKKNEISP
ncbi:SPFH domain-containing protein [Fluviispira sanaruensis]|uniref:SPFH domain-containing protein n=1 Tax=Fluviispira sanaruensis TaxID=2493639 RepID=A0A4P2VN66_FLUSA|nr:SPFH domain-containing protein [Fluviispira sanaruensis]BBH53544.1 SPFH domain-containing protein [Fluviispira sanaruensis]